MSYTLKTNIANKSNYGAKRSTSAIKYIVIHYTGNDGDTDESNAKYFKNNIVKASAHYFVDDDSVTQSVPDDYVAYAVGGSKYSNCSTTGGGSLYGVCKNANSISVELCDTVKNGIVYPSDKTIENAVTFVKTLMTKYNIPVGNVIRHFDVNGKSCPAYWCGNATKNALWLTAFRDKLTTTAATTTYTVPTPVLKKGSTGDQVKYLQIALNHLINAKLDTDGNFGEKTRTALIAWQSASALDPDGKYGKLSHDAMEKQLN